MRDENILFKELEEICCRCKDMNITEFTMEVNQRKYELMWQEFYNNPMLNYNSFIGGLDCMKIKWFGLKITIKPHERK